MILLVPLSRFRVTFEVGSGRPYSRLEALILSAVADGVGTLDELRETFGIHPRLLIEGLVTLTQAGWLAVSSAPGRSFVLTPEGQQALGAGENPSTLLILPKEAYVLMERITGQLLSARGLRYVVDRELEPVRAECVELCPRVSDQHTDASQVQHLLPHAQGEWIRWVGPIDLVGRDFQWLPITADLESGRITGLPDGWKHLQEVLLEQARQYAGKLSPDVNAAAWRQTESSTSSEQDASSQPTTSWSIALGPCDFLSDSAAHEAYLHEVLRTARSAVFISSAFVTLSRLNALQELLADALRRGVSIDLLWGYGAEREALNSLTNQDIHARRQGWPGRLRFNRNASESHAKLVLWDHAPNHFEACLGSCNWLSFATPGGEDYSEVSVKFDRHGLMAQLCRCAASLWEGAKDALSAVPGRWQQVAAEMERLEITHPSSESTNSKVRLILDSEHEWCLRDWLRDARRRLLIASHQLGPASATRLVAAEGRTRDPEFSFVVSYSHTDLDETRLEHAKQIVIRADGSFVRSPRQHGKVIVCDDVACVSSYNFLSADPFQTARGARELGVVVQGRESADCLFERLNWCCLTR